MKLRSTLGEGDEIDRWWLEENVLMIHHKHSSSGSYKDYEILFVNDKYPKIAINTTPTITE